MALTTGNKAVNVSLSKSAGYRGTGKHIQAVAMLGRVAKEFTQSDIMVVTDSWSGNNGLFKPLRKEIGKRTHMLSRLRSNNNLFGLPIRPTGKSAGRPRKYGDKLGTTSSLALINRALAPEMKVNLYGRV